MTTNPTPLETAMQGEPQQAILARAWKLWALFTKATPDKTVALDTLVGFLTTQCEKLYARNLELIGDPFGKQLTEVEAERDALRERVKELEEVEQTLLKAGATASRILDHVERTDAENAQLRERVEALEKAQRWIPVTEEVPRPSGLSSESDFVLVLERDGEVSTAYFDHETGIWYNDGHRVHATHWQPLPTAPTEKGGEAK